MKIYVDNREQRPILDGEPKTLNVGDYTTKLLFNKFHIERKSLSDLYGTLTTGNSRFKYELFRAAWHSINIEVHVEGTFDDFINKRFAKGNERKFPSEGLERLIKTFEKRYFLKFYFHAGRPASKKAILARLAAEVKALKRSKNG